MTHSMRIALAGICLAGSVAAAGAPATRRISYTPDQAWQGRLAYYDHCAECHGGDLAGNFAPALAGTNSELQWLTGKYVYGYITVSMPHGDPGALSPTEYIDIMAFLYQQHHRPAGREPLTKQALNADVAPLGGQ